VIGAEHIAAISSSAAYMLAYAAQPCAHCRYQPSPDFTPSISATTSTANDARRPMNNPTNTCGSSGGQQESATMHGAAPCDEGAQKLNGKSAGFFSGLGINNVRPS
jgi:hypothetical protein